MKTKVLILLCVIAGWRAGAAINVGAFGSHGEGGAKNGQSFTLGPGGSVYELDAFLTVGGYDLNGALPGTSAALSRHALPAGLLYTFSSTLSTNLADLVLTYTFTNTTTNVFANLRFGVLLDAEIDQATTTFFNEYGAMTGTPGRGAYDGSPDMWQIDEPGFQTGTLFRNLHLGALSNSNAVPAGTSNDVAMAIGFLLGSLQPTNSVSVRVMISEAGHSTGTLALTQRDPAPGSTTAITLSGLAEVKEAASPFQSVAGVVPLNFQWRLDRPSGSLIGTLSLTNPPGSGWTLDQPFQLGLQSSTNFSYVSPAGTLDNGMPYVDLTTAIVNQLGVGGIFDAGRTVVVDGIKVFSRDRSPPPTSLFELWATQR